jgi:hypothetical protein
MKKIFIALLVLTSCVEKTKDFPSGCETQIVDTRVDKNGRYQDFLLIHCKDTVYYLLEDKLLYKFPVKK